MIYLGTPVVQEEIKISPAATKTLPKDKEENIFFYEARTPRYHYKDLILPQNVLHELEVLQSMIKNHDLVYHEWGMKENDPYGEQTAFNLYGPPGTGKTMIVEALCDKWGKKLIDINLSQLESKYVGETGKNIVKAFDAAKNEDAVLFFDEADTVLGKRLSNVTQSADSSVNTARGVMLKQLEQHTGIVAFATNFACNYDPAFVRRILKHINVPLPDKENRIKLWQSKIPVNFPNKNNLSFEKLAEESEELSGGDILVATKNALFDIAASDNVSLPEECFLKAIASVKSSKENIGKKPVVL
jgi:SpoVK/Ycf46/Vps4 family AAA+-type ATPase